MPEKARLAVRVLPRASRNEIAGFDRLGTLRVRVTAAPVDGAANKAVINLLAEALGVARSAVSVTSGHSGRSKLINIDGIDGAEARRRLTR